MGSVVKGQWVDGRAGVWLTSRRSAAARSAVRLQRLVSQRLRSRKSQLSGDVFDILLVDQDRVSHELDEDLFKGFCQL